MICVLDTSVVSAVMHRDAMALERLAACAPMEVLLTTPVAAEICFGLACLDPDSRKRRLLTNEFERLVGAVGWADWTRSASKIFGIQKAELRRRGTPIDDMDIAIGSIAISMAAVVATRNTQHFERLQGLAVDDWTIVPP